MVLWKIVQQAVVAYTMPYVLVFISELL